MKISVLGAGAWGTALAGVAAAAGHDVCLWARDAAQVAAMQAAHENQRYLPGVPLPSALRLTARFDEALAHARGPADARAAGGGDAHPDAAPPQAEPPGLVVIATPTSALRRMLTDVPAGVPVLWLSKGFEAGSGALGHEIARALRPGSPHGVLSGPSFAIEVARGQPTALVAASTDASLVALAVEAFHGDALRIYRSGDPTGVEVGGAVKNVLAIATGILDGLAQRAGATPGAGVPGLNARAALITRGLAEMTRLGVALGAQPSTFMGLSGLGDLVLTATGALSRNRQVGLELAAGRSLDEALASLGHVAEGVYSARTVAQRAAALGVEMPITTAVVAVLEGRMGPSHAVAQLMSREARAEF